MLKLTSNQSNVKCQEAITAGLQCNHNTDKATTGYKVCKLAQSQWHNGAPHNLSKTQKVPSPPKKQPQTVRVKNRATMTDLCSCAVNTDSLSATQDTKFTATGGKRLTNDSEPEAKSNYF